MALDLIYKSLTKKYKTEPFNNSWTCKLIPMKILIPLTPFLATKTPFWPIFWMVVRWPKNKTRWKHQNVLLSGSQPHGPWDAPFMGHVSSDGELERQSWFYFWQFHVIGFLNLVHPVSNQMGRSEPLECEINSISSFFSYKYRF